MSATVRACVPYGIAKQGHMRYRRQRLICVAAAEGSTAGDGGDGMRGDGQVSHQAKSRRFRL